MSSMVTRLNIVSGTEPLGYRWFIQSNQSCIYILEAIDGDKHFPILGGNNKRMRVIQAYLQNSKWPWRSLKSFWEIDTALYKIPGFTGKLIFLEGENVFIHNRRYSADIFPIGQFVTTTKHHNGKVFGDQMYLCNRTELRE